MAASMAPEAPRVWPICPLDDEIGMRSSSGPKQLAKAALSMLTRSLAKDLAPDIRVNGVAPGAILWPEDEMADATKATIVKQIPLERPGDPADIAGCVLYLVRDAAYVTGQIIAVDGGRSIGW